MNSEKLTGGDWYAATSGDDVYHYGPHNDPRDALGDWLEDHDDDAGKTADKDRGFTGLATVIYATNPPIRLADWLNAGTIIEAVEDDIYSNDRANSEYDDGPVFAATPHQIADLDRRLKAAADEWQAANNLKFGVSTFDRILFRQDIAVTRVPGQGKDAALDLAVKILRLEPGHDHL
ncbi:hypothetical protein ACUSIJ_24715 [Pseudochelatococcus sp. B33]